MAWLALALGACQDRPAAPSGPDASAVGTWELTPLPVQTEQHVLYDMTGAGPDLYLVGTGGLILQSRDDGRSWVNVGPPATGPAGVLPYFLAVAATAADDVWVGGADGVSSVGGSRPGDGLLLHSVDRGESWLPSEVGDGQHVHSLWALDHQRVLVATNGGQIWRTETAGQGWARVFVDANTTVFDFWSARQAAGDAAIYAVGSTNPGDAAPPDAGADGGADAGTQRFRGFVLRSLDGGATWETVLDDAPCQFWNASGTPDGNAIYAAGDCGTLAASSDGGASWSVLGVDRRDPSRDSDERFAIGGVWVSPSGRTYLARNREVCRWLEVAGDGVAWTTCETLPPRRFDGSVSAQWTNPMGLWGRDDANVWAYGGYGFLWRRR